MDGLYIVTFVVIYSYFVYALSFVLVVYIKTQKATLNTHP